MNWSGIKHFSPQMDPKLGQSGVPGSAENMDREFMLKLDHARDLANQVMTVNSGWRSVEREKQILAGKPGLIVPSMQGANPFSSHTSGHGVDISCVFARDRYLIIANAIAVGFVRMGFDPKLVPAALEAGINRIGFDSVHVHLDDEPRLPARVIW